MVSFPLRLQTIISTTSTLSSSQAQQQSSTMGAPSNGSKTAHSKVANGTTNAGTSGNNNQTTSKRSSSGADGDYQLVQHEVLYSQSSQYEVSSASFRTFLVSRAWRLEKHKLRNLNDYFHFKESKYKTTELEKRQWCLREVFLSSQESDVACIRHIQKSEKD